MHRRLMCVATKFTKICFFYSKMSLKRENVLHNKHLRPVLSLRRWWANGPGVQHKETSKSRRYAEFSLFHRSSLLLVLSLAAHITTRACDRPDAQTSLKWPSGTENEITVNADESVLTVVMAGEAYEAKIQAEGRELLWSDGDVWTRQK